MPLSTDQLALIEQRVTNDGPSTGAAYLLWFLLGGIAAHRFYLGKPLSALVFILCWITIVIPVVWWIVDGFAMGGMVRDKRDQVRQRLTTQMLATGGVA